MALVLAIEPDVRQATVLRRVIREHVGADLTVVDSRDAALAAIAERIPDVILLTALLSPRDEDELFSRLRAMEGADHVQTHSIPQLASAAAVDIDDREQGRGLFGKLRRKKADPEPIPGCDPELFAEEIVTFLQRAAELKARGGPSRARIESAGPRPAERIERAEFEPEPVEPPPATGSAWASPFEWRPSSSEHRSETPASPIVTEPPVTPPVVASYPQVEQEDVEERIARAARHDAEAAAERIRMEAEREAERRQMETEREVAREKERQRVEAEREAERVRVEAEREKERLRVLAEREAERLRVDAERQRVAAEREKERLRIEAERKKAEADAAAARRLEAERLREEAAKEKERLRKQAEEEKERLRLEAAREAERLRVQAEREAERLRVEAELQKHEAERKKAEAERKRLEAERQKAAAEREKERLRLEAERQKAEAERRRFEAEAAAARQREAERLRQEAQREAERLRLEAERERKEAERQKQDAERQAERMRVEAERQKKEADAAATRQREAERLRLEAEREADRLREEALREAERLRAQAEEEAARARAEEAIAAAKTQEEARERQEAEKARKRSVDRVRKHREAVHDAFSEFRDDPVERPRGAVRLVPLSVWARIDRPATVAPETARDELRELMKGLSIPPHVAGVTYPRGCRIRRVRVPAAPAGAKGRGHKEPLILSRRALDEARSGGTPT